MIKTRLLGKWLDPLYISKHSLRQTILATRPYVRGRLLDIGCGRKPYVWVFDVRQYIGIEVLTTLSGSNVVDIYGDGLHLPFRNEVFDSILCTEVLEHVTMPADLFREAHRVLRHGGYFVLSAPLVWGLHEEPNDFFRYTKYGLRHLAQLAGFRVINIWPTCGVWATAGQRTSSFIFSRYGKRHGVFRQAVVALFCAMWQALALGLDWLHNSAGDTLDNVLVAQKE